MSATWQLWNIWALRKVVKLSPVEVAVIYHVESKFANLLLLRAPNIFQGTRITCDFSQWPYQQLCSDWSTL